MSKEDMICDISKKYAGQKIVVSFKNLNEEIHSFVSQLSKSVAVSINVNEIKNDSTRAVVLFCESGEKTNTLGKEVYKVFLNLKCCFNAKIENALISPEFIKKESADFAYAFNIIAGSAISSQNIFNANLLWGCEFTDKAKRLLAIISHSVNAFKTRDIAEICDCIMQYLNLESEFNFNEFCPAYAAMLISGKSEDKLVYAFTANKIISHFLDIAPFCEIDNLNTLDKLQTARQFGFEKNAFLNLMSFKQNKVIIYKLSEFKEDLKAINKKTSLLINILFSTYKRLQSDGGYLNFQKLNNREIFKSILLGGLYIKPNILSIMHNLGLVD